MNNENMNHKSNRTLDFPICTAGSECGERQGILNIPCQISSRSPMRRRWRRLRRPLNRRRRILFKWGGKVPANLKLPPVTGILMTGRRMRLMRTAISSMPTADRLPGGGQGRAADPGPVRGIRVLWKDNQRELYSFNNNGNRGIAAGLGNIQKLRDGESLGGRSNAEEDLTWWLRKRISLDKEKGRRDDRCPFYQMRKDGRYHGTDLELDIETYSDVDLLKCGFTLMRTALLLKCCCLPILLTGRKRRL